MPLRGTYCFPHATEKLSNYREANEMRHDGLAVSVFIARSGFNPSRQLPFFNVDQRKRQIVVAQKTSESTLRLGIHLFIPRRRQCGTLLGKRQSSPWLPEVAEQRPGKLSADPQAVTSEWSGRYRGLWGCRRL
jgi:hypothetical protein